MNRDAIVNVTGGGGVLYSYPERKFFVLSYEAAEDLFINYRTGEKIKIFAVDEDEMRIQVIEDLMGARKFFKKDDNENT